MAYSLYLDGVLFPVTPSKITYKVKSQNQTMNLINDGEVNFLKSPGLKELQFDLLLPRARYPFAVYTNGFQGAEYFLEKLKALKSAAAPFRFILTRTLPSGKALFGAGDGENLLVSLEDYQITEDAGDGLDISAALQLKEYKSFGTKTVTLEKAQSGETPKAAVQAPRAAQSAPVFKTYTVLAGDTLWNIAKKTLGDGARYTELYNLNKDKITNPSLIQPGQVFKMP